MLILAYRFPEKLHTSINRRQKLRRQNSPTQISPDMAQIQIPPRIWRAGRTHGCTPSAKVRRFTRFAMTVHLKSRNTNIRSPCSCRQTTSYYRSMLYLRKINENKYSFIVRHGACKNSCQPVINSLFESVFHQVLGTVSFVNMSYQTSLNFEPKNPAQSPTVCGGVQVLNVLQNRDQVKYETGLIGIKHYGRKIVQDRIMEQQANNVFTKMDVKE
jgi:hypothetical protein